MTASTRTASLVHAGRSGPHLDALLGGASVSLGWEREPGVADPRDHAEVSLEHLLRPSNVVSGAKTFASSWSSASVTDQRGP